MKITLNEKTYTVDKANLRLWCSLEDINFQFIDACKEGKRLDMCDRMCEYVNKYIPELDFFKFAEIDWWEVVQAYMDLVKFSIPKRKIPLLLGNTERKDSPWDYPGRTWYMMANTFAANYHWTLEYIADLKVDDAFSLMQEIILDEQFKKEWEWGMTEIAYPYNSNTKKSEFKPLPRPAWMKAKVPTGIKKMKILKELIPVGNVMDLMKDYQEGLK